MMLLEQQNTIVKNTLIDISAKYPDKKFLLDIGCGSGARTSIFNDFGRELIGCDRVRYWLDDRYKNAFKFIEGDFVDGTIPLDNEYADIIFNYDVIEHLLSPEKLLKETYRLLKKDGIFIVSTPNRNRILNFILLKLGLRHFPSFPDYKNKDPEYLRNDPYAAHVYEYTVPDLEMLLYKHNFRVIKTHKIFYGHQYGIKNLFGFPFFHNIIMECIKV